MYLFAQICNDNDSIRFVHPFSSRTQEDSLPTSSVLPGECTGTGYVPAGIADSECMGFTFLLRALQTSLVKARQNEMPKAVHVNVTLTPEADQLSEK